MAMAAMKDHLEIGLYLVALPCLLRFGLVEFGSVGFEALRRRVRLQHARSALLTSRHGADVELGSRAPRAAASLPEIPPRPPGAEGPSHFLEPWCEGWRHEWGKLGYSSKAQAFLVSAARILFYHSLQPVLNFLAFFVYSDQMDELELLLAGCVLARETLYALCILSAGMCTPALFLYAPTKNSFTKTLSYALMPEKFLVLGLLHSVITAHDRRDPAKELIVLQRCGRVNLAIAPFLLLGDAAGLAATVIFIAKGHLDWGPLLLGYALSGICFLTGLSCCYLCCEFDVCDDVLRVL